MKSRHGSLFWRTASSLVAAPMFLLLLFLGGWPLRVLAAGLALLGLREYFALRLEKRDPALEFTAYVLLLFFFLPGKSLEWLGFLAVLSLLALATAGLLRGGALLTPTVAVAFFGLWYTGGGLFYLPELRSAGGGMGHLLVAVLATWAVDVAAFFVGTILGRHKLAPTLSPGKTVEGALGGAGRGVGRGRGRRALLRDASRGQPWNGVGGGRGGPTRRSGRIVFEACGGGQGLG